MGRAEGNDVEGDARARKRSGVASVDLAEFRKIVEQMERVHHEIESLVNRTNTLVHLLDILNKRVDRLESKT